MLPAAPSRIRLRAVTVDIPAGASTPSQSRDVEHNEYPVNGPLLGCDQVRRLSQQSWPHRLVATGWDS
jgi:hypothetical protein